MGLALFFTQPCPPANDLLEFRHRADHLIQNNQLGHLAVSTRGEELGGRGDNRILLGHRRKLLDLPFADFVTASDPNHIVRVLLHHIPIQLGQHISHSQGCILCSTEHNGSGHPVCTLEVMGDLLGYFPDTILYNNVVVIVAVGIDAVWYLVAIDIQLALLGTPSFSDVGGDIDDLEGSEEAIINALLQAVSVDGLSEIAQVGNILGFLGRGSHANLNGIREVFQNPPPAAFLLG